MRLKIKNKEKKKRKVGAAMFSDWKFPHLLSLLSILNFVPLPTVWTPPGFFFLPFPPPAVPMLCWERVGVKYTVPVRNALSLGSAWVGLVTLWIGGLTSGIPIRSYPSPDSPVHQMLISGNFRIPECYAVWFWSSRRSGLSISFSPFLFFLPCITDIWPRR